MNTQKMNTNTNSKKSRTVNNENSWNNITELVKNRKQQKLQKKELFEEKFSNISKILITKIQNNNKNIYEEIQEAINIRIAYKIMYKMGSYYGYPKCCTNDFVIRMHNEQKIKPIQEVAGRYSGYIPCVKCSKYIITKNLSLNDLIKNRTCKNKFPIDDEKNGFIPCKKHALFIFLKKMSFNQVTSLDCSECIDLEKYEFNGNETCKI
jgi:hypothetical protein